MRTMKIALNGNARDEVQTAAFQRRLTARLVKLNFPLRVYITGVYDPARENERDATAANYWPKIA